MGNQQQNRNLKFTGKIIKSEHQLKIINKYCSGESLMQLSNQYGYNIASIRYFLLKNGVEIRSVKESVKKFHKQYTLNIDDFLNENLIGWLLGDGGMKLMNNSINPFFNYTDKKQDHVKYISDILSKYKIKHNIYFNKNNECFHLQSETRPEFHKYYELFYGYKDLNENNQKRKILPNVTLTPIILRNWFIGDGSSVKQQSCNNHKGQISCKYKNEFILDQLNKLFNKVAIYEYKNSSGTTYYTYSISNKNFIKFLDYIGECPIESYKYKWITRCSTTIIETSDNKSDEGIV